MKARSPLDAAPLGRQDTGELRVDMAGPVTRTGLLVLAGFDEPVDQHWDLER